MIFYFSATGNSRHVAQKIAEKTGDELIDIVDCMKMGRFSFDVKADENVGIISPTYDWILPSIVDDFLGKLKINMSRENYLFFIATYGTLTGQTGRLTNNYMREKGYPLKAYFCVKMPDTWTPVFNLSDKSKVQKINEKADLEIDQVVAQIANKKCVDEMHHKTPHLIVGITKKKYEKVRRTSHLHVDDSCISCGLCAKKCPVSVIEIKDGRPVWVKDQCVMCLGCLHRCPKFSIQYDNRTKNHGQYTHPSGCK
jgi:ferredoxin